MASVRDLIQQKNREAARLTLPFVRQLAVPDEEGMELIPAGSAVLVLYRDIPFLVTAAHVVNLYPDCSYYLGTGSSWLDIGRAFTMPHDSADRDVYDFAFHRIADDAVNKLDGCQFVEPTQMLVDDEPRFDPPNRSKYFALGYPLNRFETDTRTKTTFPKSLSYLATIASLDQHRMAKRDPRHHIVLDYKARAVVGPKGTQRSPKVIGISGGGLFTFSIDAMLNLQPPRLAGITVEQFPEQRVLIGLRLGVVLGSIDKALRHAI